MPITTAPINIKTITLLAETIQTMQYQLELRFTPCVTVLSHSHITMVKNTRIAYIHTLVLDVE